MVNNSKKDMTVNIIKNSTVKIRVGCPPNWKIAMKVLQRKHLGKLD